MVNISDSSSSCENVDIDLINCSFISDTPLPDDDKSDDQSEVLEQNDTHKDDHQVQSEETMEVFLDLNGTNIDSNRQQSEETMEIEYPSESINSNKNSELKVCSESSITSTMETPITSIIPPLILPINSPAKLSCSATNEISSCDEGFKKVKQSKKNAKSEVQIVICAENAKYAKHLVETCFTQMKMPVTITPVKTKVKCLENIANSRNHYAFSTILTKSQLKTYKEEVDGLSEVMIMSTYDVSKNICYNPKKVNHCPRCDMGDT